MARGGEVVPTAPPSSGSQWRWTSVHDQYKTIEILGQGTYGVVYKAEHKATGELVAMKRCRLDAFRDFGIPETTLREIALLRDLRHENIMTLYHVSCNTERLYLVCEYLDLDLKKYIRARPRGIAVRKVKEITYELFKGLAFCHGHRVIHRDLKPHNVLVSSDLSKIKIADFGLARSALAPGKTLTHEVITLWYRAPELLLGHCNYTSGVDIWSLGCIIAELLSSKPLYVGDSEIDTLFKIFRLLGTPKSEDWPQHAVVSWNDFPKFAGQTDPFDNLVPGGLDSDGKDLLTRIFKFNSDERISALEALEHPWLAEIREQAIAAGEELMKPEWVEWENSGELNYYDEIAIDDEKSTVPTTTTAIEDYQEDKNVDYDDGGEQLEKQLENQLEIEKNKDDEEDEAWMARRKGVGKNELNKNQQQGVVNREETKRDEQQQQGVVPQVGGKQQQQYQHDVAKMAQRMKELEAKLREVERQRVVAEPANQRANQNVSQQQTNRIDPSTGGPTRPTTATSSPTTLKEQKGEAMNVIKGDGDSEMRDVEQRDEDDHADESEDVDIENDHGRIPEELSAMRRHKFGVRRKTIEVDEVLVKDKKKEDRLQQAQQQQQQARPISRRGMKGPLTSNNSIESNVKGNQSNRTTTSTASNNANAGGGRARATVELMGRLRRSSLGNFIEQRRRRKDVQNQQQSERADPRGGESTNMKRTSNTEQPPKDVNIQPNDGRKRMMGQAQQQQVGRGYERQGSSSLLQHDYSVDSTSLDGNIVGGILGGHRPYHNNQPTTMKTVLPQAPRNVYNNSVNSSGPPSTSSSLYRMDQTGLPPPPSSSSSSTNWRQQHPGQWNHRRSEGVHNERGYYNNDYNHPANDPYGDPRYYHQHAAARQQRNRFTKQHQQQTGSGFNHHHPHPNYNNPHYHTGSTNHPPVETNPPMMERIKENPTGNAPSTSQSSTSMSVLRHSLPTSTGSYYNNNLLNNCYPPPPPPSSINNPSMSASSSTRDLTSSFGQQQNNNPSLPNSKASSFWGGRDLALDVECSFNWTTTNQDDNTFRQHRRGPSFQPSTYQGMMYSSSDASDRWRRSSSYGGSGVKENIAQLNLKVAANASIFPASFDRGSAVHHPTHVVSSQQRVPSFVRYQGGAPGSRSRRNDDLDGSCVYEPSSGHYIYEDSILRRSTSQYSFNGLRRQYSNQNIDPTAATTKLVTSVNQHREFSAASSSRQSVVELSGHHYYQPYYQDPYNLRSIRRHTIELSSVNRK